MIKIWNPYSSRLETEKVYGDAAINFLYRNRLGRVLRPALTLNKIASRGYGIWQSSRLSREKIPAFVRNFEISMDEFVEENYRSFNDFFIRRFKENSRNFIADPHLLPAPCEARYFFFPKATPDLRAVVKGARLNPLEILASSKYASRFANGPIAIARLCPVDYHRFHFPDDCKILEHYTAQGKLESVNPLAVSTTERLFLENERAVSILDSKNFGLCAMVEVGALCVGKIHQSYNERAPLHHRGEEKGYFLFGGSTVILFFEPDRVQWRSEFLAKSQEGIEVFVKLGDVLGRNS